MNQINKNQINLNIEIKENLILAEKMPDLPLALFKTSVENLSSTSSSKDLTSKIIPPIPFSSKELKGIFVLLGYDSRLNIEKGLSLKAIKDFLSEDSHDFTSKLKKLKELVALADNEGIDLKDFEDLDEPKIANFKKLIETHFPQDLYKDLLTFFDEIKLYANTLEYKNPFAADTAPSLTSNLLENTNTVSSPTTPTILENQGEITEISRLTGLYSRRELYSYFNSLQKTLEEEENTLAFKLSSGSNHLSLGYIPSQKTWFIIDPKTLILQEIAEVSDLSDAVFSAFNANYETILPITAEIYGTKCNKPSLQRVITQWENTNEYKKIHEITQKKLTYTSPTIKTSWLGMAARFGDLKAVEALVKAGAYVDHQDIDGKSPLRIAALNGHTKIVSVLIKAQADVNLRSKEGYTPLIAASYNQHTDIVTLLLEAKADVNSAQKDGYTALMFAAQKGYTDIATLLLKAKADVDSAQKDGYTALMLASQKGYTDIATLLLKAKADVDLAQKKGFTALMLASQEGHTDIASLLLEAKADVNLATQLGTTALMFTSQKGYTDITTLLLKAKADVNLATQQGMTALMFASEDGNTDIATLLLEAKADVNLATQEGWTALKEASYKKNIEMMQLLYKYGAIRTPTHGDLLNISLALGYKETRGVCNGIAFKGLEAFCTGDLNSYQKMIENLNELAKKIEESGKLLPNLTEIPESPIWIEQFIKENSPELLIDLLAFLDGVHLHQQADVYPEFFQKFQKPQLAQLHVERLKIIAPLTDSLKLESLGGLEEIKRFTGVYTKEMLVSYFESFLEAAKQISSNNLIGLQLSSIGHAITVGYDFKKQVFTFIDANDPTIKNFDQADAIAEKVFYALLLGDDKENIPMSTELYSIKNEQNELKNMCDDWENTDTFQDIHTVKNLPLDIHSLRLRMAARANDVKGLEALLQIEKSGSSQKYASYFYKALWQGHAKAAEAFLQAGLDPNYKDEDGTTLLMDASIEGHAKIADLLLTAGADIDAVDVDDETAATYAASRGHFDTLKTLLNKKLSEIFASTVTKMNLA